MTPRDIFDPPLPDEALTQLLILLSPHPLAAIETRAQIQTQVVFPNPLHPSLRRQRASFRRFHAQARPDPRSCPLHAPLRTPPLRALSLLIAREAVDAQRFRPILALGHDPPPRVEAWLARCSALAGIAGHGSRWRDLFTAWICAGASSSSTSRFRSCRACALGVVGGSMVYLADLRASLLARWRYHAHKLSAMTAENGEIGGDTGHRRARTRGGTKGREPRLLSVVERWISLRAGPEQAQIRAASEALAASLLALRGVPADAIELRGHGAEGFGHVHEIEELCAEAARLSEGHDTPEVEGMPGPVPASDRDEDDNDDYVEGDAESDGLWTSRVDSDSLSRFFDPGSATGHDSAPAPFRGEEVLSTQEVSQDARRASAVPPPLAVDPARDPPIFYAELAPLDSRTWI